MSDLICLDFETYYAADYSLRLKKYNTSEYIRDEQFLIHGCSFQYIGHEPYWIAGHDEALKECQRLDLHDRPVVAHNMAFDGFILHQHAGIHCGTYCDTLSMARAAVGIHQKLGLDDLAQLFAVGAKISGLLDTKGKRKLTDEEAVKLGAYCNNDVALCMKIYDLLLPYVPEDEMKLIDITLRMFCTPKLEIDINMVWKEYQNEIQGKAEAIERAETEKEILSSNPKFAQLLWDLGVEPPTKISPTTGKETFAFAKTDQGFKDLLTHENEAVKYAAEARMLVKSTIGETRALRMHQAGLGGCLPVLLNYCAAHTFRWTGGNKLNLQNLPRGGQLRLSIMAPEGYLILVNDQSQIEARLTVWMSGQEDVLQAFRDFDAGTGSDVYKLMAVKIYRIPVDRITPAQRFIGKVCIAEGTLVLTDTGEKPIEEITLEDKLWDGVEWVSHNGLIYNGEKDVITYEGLTATPDHGVFTEQGPLPFGFAASRLYPLVTTGNAGQEIRVRGNYFARHIPPEIEHLRVHQMYKLWQKEIDYERKFGKGIEQRLSTLFTNKKQTFNNTWSTLRCYFSSLFKPTMSKLQMVWGTGDKEFIPIPNGFYSLGNRESTTRKLQQNRNRQDRQQWPLRTRKLASSNSKTANSQSTQYSKNYVERKMDKSRPFSESLQPQLDVQTSDNKQTERRRNTRKVRVYDILNAGPRKRFTAGNKLVFNCVLGMGFGMGWQRLKLSLAIGFMGPPVIIDEMEARRIVNVYRSANPFVVKFWEFLDRILEKMATDKSFSYQLGPIIFKYESVILPSGLSLKYPHMRYDGDKVSYFGRYGRTNIWGGYFLENLAQALARCIIAENMLEISERNFIATMTHDEIVSLSSVENAAEDFKWQQEIMTRPVAWAPGLPLAVDGGFDKRYSK